MIELTLGTVVQLAGGAILSTGFLAAVIAGIAGDVRSRREAKLAAATLALSTEKNEDDAEGALVDRYRAAAAEERAQKESAVGVMERLLEVAERQIAGLKDVIERLTHTIEVMTETGKSQQSLIDMLTAERDLLAAMLKEQESEVATLAIPYPTEDIRRAREAAVESATEEQR